MGVSIQKKSSLSGRRRGGRSAFTDINVTPLVDVMLVLLVIFMVTAPMLTVSVPVDLPKTHAAQSNDQEKPLVVTIDATGVLYLQETAMTEEQMIGRLIAISQGNPEARIYVRGDEKLSYGTIMAVMGAISKAGFNRVSLMAEMPGGPPAQKQKLPQKTMKRP